MIYVNHRPLYDIKGFVQTRLVRILTRWLSPVEAGAWIECILDRHPRWGSKSLRELYGMDEADLEDWVLEQI